MSPLETVSLSTGLDYKKITEFNNVAVAYRYCRGAFPEIHYATWQKDETGNPDYIRHFRMCGDAINEQQAMRDFCVRSGLIRECDLLANENLPDLSQAIERMLAKGQDLNDAEILAGLKEQAHKIMHEPKEMIISTQALQQGFEANAQMPESNFQDDYEGRYGDLDTIWSGDGVE